jgi:hypothetical protein
MPGARFVMVKLPAPLLTASLSIRVALLWTVTFAFATRAPDESEIVPERDEESDCAKTGAVPTAHIARNNNSARTLKKVFFNTASEVEEMTVGRRVTL